jgi:hypothetical protein
MHAVSFHIEFRKKKKAQKRKKNLEKNAFDEDYMRVKRKRESERETDDLNKISPIAKEKKICTWKLKKRRERAGEKKKEKKRVEKPAN